MAKAFTSPPVNANRSHQLVVFAAVGTAGIVIIADFRSGKTPTARQLVGLGFVFAALAGVAAVEPVVAGPFALLVFTGVLLAKGPAALKGIQVASADTSPLVGAPQPGADVSATGSSLPSVPTGPLGADQEPSPQAKRAVAFAKAAIGTPYVRGGTSSAGYDCSGLTDMAYKAAGVNIGRTSEDQYAMGFPSVRWGAWAPGDLVFSQWPGDDAAPGHVVMYVGGGRCIAAPHTGATVEYEPVSTFAAPHYMGSVRPAPLQRPGIGHGHGPH